MNICLSGLDRVNAGGVMEIGQKDAKESIRTILKFLKECHHGHASDAMWTFVLSAVWMT
jgi:hypothetical protein